MRIILLAIAALSLAGCVVEPLHGYNDHGGNAGNGAFFHHHHY